MGNHAVSDRYLQSLWRKAVLKSHDNRCVICGKKRADSELECHHVVKRRVRVLRHDHKNGVPVCSNDCHGLAHTLAGQGMISEALGVDRMAYLAERERWMIKDYRMSLSHSPKEHEKCELAKLKKVIEGLED